MPREPGAVPADGAMTCGRCGQPTDGLLEFGGELCSARPTCDPCFDALMAEIRAMRRRHAMLIANGISPERANQIMHAAVGP